MNRPVRILLALGLTVTGLGVAPQVASAATPCYQTGALTCLYSSSGYGGTLKLINDGATSGPCQLSAMGGGRENFASSVYNNSVNTQYMWVDTNFRGSKLTISRQSGKSSLSSTYNKKLSSWKGTCYSGT